MNECVQSGAFTDNSFRTSVYHFVSENYVSDPDGIVFTLEAHRSFCDMFVRMVDITRFSMYYSSAAKEMYWAEKTRFRINPDEHPRKVVKGIRKRVDFTRHADIRIKNCHDFLNAVKCSNIAGLRLQNFL